MRRRRATTLLPGLVLGLVMTAGACSGGSDDTSSGDSTSSPEPTGSATATDVPEVRTQLSVAHVAGRLSKPKRLTMRSDVKHLVDGWLDHAYLGTFPRTDYSAAFTGFTPGARADARKDLWLLTNRNIADRIDTAVAAHRRVKLDVLAVHRRAVGATARVRLLFTTSGALERSERIRGSLFLIHRGGEWLVFGYHVTKDVVRGRA